MTEVPLARIRLGRRARKDLGDLSLLRESIESIGFLHPIVVDEKDSLIAGQRRLEACEAETQRMDLMGARGTIPLNKDLK